MNKQVKTLVGVTAAGAGLFFVNPLSVSAHCDTTEGPVVHDAQNALESDNVNYILKWVGPEREEEITDLFDQVSEVRELSPEAKDLADQSLFERLVRIHREGEGAPFTGVKEEPVAAPIAAADASIAAGSFAPMEEAIEEGIVDEELEEALQSAFDDTIASVDFDVNDVEAGREYVGDYVVYTHLAEGGHEAEHDEDEDDQEHTEADSKEIETHESETEEVEEPEESGNWFTSLWSNLFN